MFVNCIICGGVIFEGFYSGPKVQFLFSAPLFGLVASLGAETEVWVRRTEKVVRRTEKVVRRTEKEEELYFGATVGFLTFFDLILLFQIIYHFS